MTATTSDRARSGAPATYRMRRWSVRNARLLAASFSLFMKVFAGLNWLWALIGYRHVERPIAFVERHIKGFLFDCRMCGQCALSDTGMSCPMNCPKSIRNGPCGGVRANGNCELQPDMPCVWVQAWAGSQRMGSAARIAGIQHPVDHSRAGKSDWLRVAKLRARPANPGTGGESGHSG